MKCERCGKAKAKIHMTEIVNEDEKREHHLCEQCAEALGYAPPHQHFTISELLKGLASGEIAAKGDKASDVELGARLGMGSILVRTGYGLESEAGLGERRPAAVLDDLAAAVDWILAGERSP